MLKQACVAGRLMLLAFLAGCAGDMDPAGPDDEGSGGPSPVNVAATPDGSRAPAKEVGAAGGKVTATGADGTTYTLTIPKGALRTATGITLTPIQAVSGFPWQSFTAGVLPAPEDLRFALPATLVITRPAAANPLTATAFAFSGQGAGFHMYPIAKLSGSTVELEISHFSGAGFGQATPARRTAQLQSVPATGAARVEQLRAQAERRRSNCFGAGCQAGEPTVTMTEVEFALTMLGIDITAALDAVRPGQSCLDGFEALLSASQWIQAIRGLSAAMGTAVPAAEMLQAVDAEFRGAAAVAVKNCIDEEYDKCRVPGSRLADWLSPIDNLLDLWQEIANELELPSMARYAEQRARTALPSMSKWTRGW